MLIEIASPIFKCAEDENIFYSRLYGLPNFNSAVSKGSNVHLTLADTFSDAVFEELQIICDVWGATFKVVKN